MSYSGNKLANYNPMCEVISVPTRKKTAARFHPSLTLKSYRQGLYLKILSASQNPQHGL